MKNECCSGWKEQRKVEKGMEETEMTSTWNIVWARWRFLLADRVDSPSCLRAAEAE